MEATDEADKFHTIYTVLTKDEIEAWRSSHDRFPRSSVTSAFREAERGLTESRCSQRDEGMDMDDDPIDNSDE